jgi:AcrR family transcriptional regulator
MRPGGAPVRRGRPPGRGPKVRTAVLAATLSELTESGYAALTVENVARRAGVHKTTVYRRWKDRESLVAEAVTELASTRVPFPNSGDISADLRALARSLVRFLASPAGQAVTAITLSDAGRIPEVASAQRHFFEDRYRQAEPVIRAAIARGELPPGTHPAEVVRAVIAPIYLRVLVTAEPISEHTADTAAGAAVAAARAGALSPPAG